MKKMFLIHVEWFSGYYEKKIRVEKFIRKQFTAK